MVTVNAKKPSTAELLELTRRLILIESVTGNESAVVDFLHAYLVNLDWHVKEIPVANNRWNIFAQRGKPLIALSTHIDTVPPFLEVSEDDTFIFGRGACDAKGS